LIALEDFRSARLYFEGFRKELRAHRVVVIAPHAGSAPKRVVSAAKQVRDERDAATKEGFEDPFDEVWVVFDTEGPQNLQRQRDARHAIDQSQQLGFHTAVSNPSFEYWFLLHFTWYVGMLHDGDAACRRLRAHIPNYGKNLDCFEVTRPHTDTAIARAKRVFAERHANSKNHPCDCHPCTEVYRLVESLLGET
jgi:hypothetical protein